MNIREIKKEMTKYRDFFGGDLLNVSDVKNAKTKEELSEIINKHNTHLEMMVCDAQCSLDRFKKKLGLNDI